MTADEMVGWHHRLDGHEYTLGVGDGQGSLACCSVWDCRVRHDFGTKQQYIASQVTFAISHRRSIPCLITLLETP